MKKIVRYLKDYIAGVDKNIFFLGALYTAIAIFINYYYGLNSRINSFSNAGQYLCWYLVFFLSFAFGYYLVTLFSPRNPFIHKDFLVLLFIAPAIFSWKMASDVELFSMPDEWQSAYWNRVVYWPLKLFITTAVLFFVWKASKEKQSFYGLTVKGFKAAPYITMLLIMVPLIAWASTQPDFLHTYPKLKNVSFLSEYPNTGVYKLLYELAYGSDFFTIELFFRGFLVLAFAKWLGKDVILPMAMFYCTIHFGKPLGECISSFFGGLILGVVTYHTRTIFGGLIVHLGIAWLMELGGYLGNMYLK
jgi:hypothetical protein